MNRAAPVIVFFAAAAHGLGASPTADGPSGCARLPSLVEELQPLEELYLRSSLKANYKGHWSLESEARTYPLPLSQESIWNASHQGYEVNKYPLHNALHRFLSGWGLHLATFGGSFSAPGPACPVPWPQRLSSLLTDLQKRLWPEWKPPVGLSNLAAEGTVTSHAVTNFHKWSKELQSADLVISEYNIDDVQLLEGAASTYSNKLLVQALGALSKKPGFVYFDLPNKGSSEGASFRTSERTGRVLEAWEGSHFDVAKALAIPLVWFLDATRSSSVNYLDANRTFTIPGTAAWSHPMCFPGHTTLAYTMYGMLLQEMHEVCSVGLPPEKPLDANIKSSLRMLSELTSSIMCVTCTHGLLQDPVPAGGELDGPATKQAQARRAAEGLRSTASGSAIAAAPMTGPPPRHSQRAVAHVSPDRWYDPTLVLETVNEDWAWIRRAADGAADNNSINNNSEVIMTAGGWGNTTAVHKNSHALEYASDQWGLLPNDSSVMEAVTKQLEEAFAPMPLKGPEVEQRLRPTCKALRP